jgi:CubicO group peptidase (beta-lactamase class C family)
MRLIVFWITMLVLSATVAAGPLEITNAPPDRDDGWSVGTLREAGFDLGKFRQFNEKLQSGKHHNAHAVVIEHDGKLVYEKYLSGQDQNWGRSIGHIEFDFDVKHDLRSISKSVTSMLLGIALGDDAATALLRPVIEYFPEFADQVAPGSENITLEQLLTMSAGYRWNEMDVPYSNNKNDEIRLYSAQDPIQYVLTKALRDEPGKTWYYNGGSTMVIAAIVAKISGMPFLSFAEEKLFKPLGISDYEWRGLGIWQRNIPGAASGLRLRARDLARIGSTMLNHGKWNGRQIVSAAWVRASSQRHIEQSKPDWSIDGIYGYGYQWWHGEFTGHWGEYTTIAGVGYGGQRLFVVPEKKLVITIYAGNYGSGDWKMPETILSEIITASH